MATAVQDTYPEDFAHCYGCGRLNRHGHRIRTFATATGTVTEHDPTPQYRGAADFAYGGLIASLIDCHSAGSAAIFWMRAHDLEVGDEPAPRFVTARLEVDYVAPTPLRPLRLEGVAEETGERKVVVTTELSAGDGVTVRGRAVLVRITAP
ncbi:MAG: PaaI family thioesterase [Acidimicrobiia bacterium]|nr:PaaI family thioesterase [Acidimicrobiia bacterium]